MEWDGQKWVEFRFSAAQSEVTQGYLRGPATYTLTHPAGEKRYVYSCIYWTEKCKGGVDVWMSGRCLPGPLLANAVYLNISWK